MKNLVIVNVDFSQEYGFFFIEFANGKSVQCCLVEGARGGYVKKINKDDCGSNEGLSYDNNEWAIGEDGDFSEINQMMFKEARKLGIKVV